MDDEDFDWGSGSGDGEILFSITCPTGIVCQYGAVCNPLTKETSCICNKGIIKNFYIGAFT